MLDDPETPSPRAPSPAGHRFRQADRLAHVVPGRAHPGQPALRRRFAPWLPLPARAPGLRRLAALSLRHGVPDVHRHGRSFRFNAGPIIKPASPSPRRAREGNNSRAHTSARHLGYLAASSRAGARTVSACSALAPPRRTRCDSSRPFVSPQRRAHHQTCRALAPPRPCGKRTPTPPKCPVTVATQSVAAPNKALPRTRPQPGSP